MCWKCLPHKLQLFRIFKAVLVRITVKFRYIVKDTIFEKNLQKGKNMMFKVEKVEVLVHYIDLFLTKLSGGQAKPRELTGNGGLYSFSL